MTDFMGFWSYVHDDDEVEGGRISQLARDVLSQYELLTGDSIPLFLDKDQLGWGDDWKSKIDVALSSVAFFVPILTPRYFQSVECRRELNAFARKANDLGLSELVMPIKYIDFTLLTAEDPKDEAVTLARSFQWEDWTELRFSSPDSPEYRRAIHRMAQRIATSISTSETSSTPQASNPATSLTILEDEEEPGYIDRMAQAEEALPAWTSTTELLGLEIQKIGSIMGDAGARIAPERQIPMPERIAIINDVARQLEEPAETIEMLTNKFTEQLNQFDSGLRVYVDRLPREIEDNPESAIAVATGFNEIKNLAHLVNDNLGFLKSMVDQFSEMESGARSLRPVSRKLRKSFTLLLEARDVAKSWLTLIDGMNLPEVTD